MLLSSIFVILSVVSSSQQAEELPDILRLRKALGINRGGMKNRIARPVFHENETIDVTVTINVSDMIGLQLDGREATVKGQACVSWTAGTLKWNPANFNGLQSLIMRRDEIWVPDIEVFNRVGFVNPYNRLATAARLFFNGSINFCEFKTMSVSCDTDMHAFPVDKHQCSVLFGSSTYNLDKLKLIPYLVRDFEKVTTRFSEWRLQAADFRLVQGTDEDYFDYTLQLDLIIERKFSSHIYQFVLPMLVGTCLTLIFCWVPLGTPQKFFVPLVGLIIMTFTTVRYSSMLGFSSTVPLSLKFLTDLIFFTAFMIFLAIAAMVCEENSSIPYPSHPLLDRFLNTSTVSNYILSDELLVPEQNEMPDSPNPAEQPLVAEKVQNWSRLLTAVQRVFSALFLGLYVVVYYLTIGSK